MIILFLLLHFSLQISYILSDDKAEFTAFGNNEILEQKTVRESKHYTQYTTANITNGIVGIGVSAFYQCEKISRFIFGTTIQSIADNAFEECRSLVQIEFPDTVKDYGKYIFKSCPILDKVKFSFDMRKIGVCPFLYSQYVSKIEIIHNSLFSTDNEGKFLIYNKTILIAVASKYTSLTIPAAIETINENCFESVIELKTLNFSNSNLTKVSDGAFASTRFTSIEFPLGTKELYSGIFNQAQITRVTLPSTLTYVSPSVFDRATKLNEVILKGNSEALESDEDNIIYLKGKTSILFIPTSATKIHIDKNTIEISSSMLQTKHNIASLTIDPNHPTMFVFNNTLYKNESMTLYSVIGSAKYVEVFDQCENIGGLSFANTQVSKVKFLGNKVKNFLTNAFSSTNYLEEMDLPEGLERFNSWSIDGTALKKLIFPSTLQELGPYFVAYSELTEANLSLCNNIKTIHDNAFSHTSCLSRIILPQNYNKISKQMFLGSGIESITIPSAVEVLGEEAFKDSKLRSIVFAETNCSLYTINSRCFMNTNLQSISIPSSVTKLQSEAFLGCNNLTQCTFDSSSNLSILEPRVFDGASLVNISFGQKLENISECAFTGCKSLQRIIIADENPYFCSIDGCVYSTQFMFIACPPGKQKVTFENRSTSIAGSAFFECTKLQSVNFGNNSGITELGKSTFLGCINLNSIDLPPKASEIKAECFSGCESLTNVTFNKGCITNNIRKLAFANCGIKLIDLSICEKLTSLSEKAFYQCINLEHVKLSGGLESIGSMCFYDCTSLLVVEFCKATESALRSADIGPSDVFGNCPDQLQVFVPYTFSQASFCGEEVVRSFDSDCMFASSRFTAGILSHSHHEVVGVIAATVFHDAEAA